jgi:hypothetical protein
MKEKRDTRCFIAATALFLILATAPLLSDLATAQMQEKFLLTVTIKNWASCSFVRSPCPYDDAMTTNVASPFSGVSETFGAGSCPAVGPHPCFGPTRTFEIIPGSLVAIHAVAIYFPDTFGIWKPEVPHFTGDLGKCSNLFSDTCSFDMPASPVHIDVNYHYEFVPIISSGVGDEGDNSDDTP